jgi:xylulokinase
MTARPTVSLGLDLGTSALKGVLVDGHARVVAQARAGYPTTRPRPGHAQQRPADWLRAVERVCATLARAVPPRRWGAIGLSAMIPTLVLVDERGQSVGPALTWEDGRAQAEAVSLRRRIGTQAWYETTGQRVDAHYLLPMWRWIAAHEPERAARAARIVAAKDFVLERLTGAVATDPSTATGFGAFDLLKGSWDSHTLSVAGIGNGGPDVPPVVPSTRTFPLLRTIADRLGLAPSTPVAVGAADSVLSADTLGVVDTDEIACVWGTSTVILWFRDRVEFDARHRYLVTPASRAGRWGYEMDLVSSGSAMRWCATLLGLGPRGEAKLISLASRASAFEDPVFLPYLGPGEQGALWDPALRGVIAGLTLRHGQAEIARALIDGILLEVRRCVSVLRPKGAQRRIRTTGAAMRLRWFRQRMADATGCEVALETIADSAAAVGAAALCDPAIGDALAARVGRPTDAATPSSSAKREWAAKWKAHEDARSRSQQLA